MPLDLSSLKKALVAMEDLAAKAEDQTIMDRLDDTLKEGIRAGVIQHFEFTYELCWKLLKRWLENNGPKGATLGITQKELYRYGAENGLLESPEAWWFYHECRNRTSETFEEYISSKVYRASLEFFPKAKALYSNLI